MKVTKRLLATAKEFSHKHYIDTYKHVDESTEDFRARCWLMGFIDAFMKEGYEIDAVDLNTGVATNIEFESRGLPT